MPHLSSLLRRRTLLVVCGGHQRCALHAGGGGMMAGTRASRRREPFERSGGSADCIAALRRATFHDYIRTQSSAFTGAKASGFDPSTSPFAAASAAVTGGGRQRAAPSRHVMEAIEVRPLSSRELSAAARTADGDGGAYRQPQRKPHTQQGEQQRQQLHVPRGQRDLQRLRDRAEGHVKMASQQRLREEYRRALEILRDIYAALQTTVLQERKQQQQQQEKFLSSTEAVRFERLHQLRDTTNRLTTAHFALLPIEAVLKFLELVGRIVALVQEPHTTAHGYVVRQALRAIFVDGDTVSPAVRSQRHRRGPLLGLHYYKLLHAMLSLPASESIEVLDSTSGVLPVEELCVRRLCCGAGESPPQHFPFLLQIGPARAVRVVAWCLRSPASTGLTAVPGRQERGRGASPLPPRSALRIPFGVGKEYTQSVLAAFAQRPCGGSATATTTARTEAEAATETKLFGVAELATLCSAIVFYEITTMEAVTVLVEAAPMCAAYVEALSGHQLSCVMLAYATLRYHGNLLRHPTPTGTALSAGNQQQTNFYLLLGERAGVLGERLREDDAARVLRALELAGVEHNGLRRSLESSMRMKGLRHRAMLSGGG